MFNMFNPLGARPKITSPKAAIFENLEETILRRLCSYGGSLSLTALNECLIQDRNIGQNSTEFALRQFLVERSPHNVRLFQLDENPRRSDCTVRVKTDAVLCSSYNPRRKTCQNGPSCSDFHLCRHFVANRCKKGPKCNWPHDFGSAHNQAVLYQSGLACLDYGNIFQILRHSWVEITMPDVCKHYNSLRSCAKDDCTFLHVCRHYVIGDCKFQNCRRSHSLRDGQPIRVWGRYDIDARVNTENDLLDHLRKKKRQEELSDSSDLDFDDPENEESVIQNHVQASQDILDICVHYNKKACRNGEQCSFLHVCRFFIHGNCKFSTGCRLSHDLKTNQVLGALQKCGIDVHGRSSEDLIALIRNRKERSGPNRQESRERRQSSCSDAGNQDKTEICEYSLRGKCFFKERCHKLHTEENFQWQYQDNGQTWTNFTKANVPIEKRFCNVVKEEVNLTTSDTTGRPSRINFKSMKGMLTKLGGEQSYDVRRLETPAIKTSEDNSWQRIWCTTWQWFYLDNGNIWVQYKDTEIEEAYQTYLTTGEGDQFEFETKQFRYILDFSRMVQKNKRIGTKREVRRRPKFVTNDDLQRKSKQMKVLAVVLPKTWDSHNLPTDPQTNFVLCELNLQLHKEEFKLVSRHFREKMDTASIVSIERVQNTELWQEFVIKREKMKSRETDPNEEPKEELLFHGTEERVVKAICQQNFDFRISGSRVGTKYGQGSYFSKSAKYSDHYASPDTKGKQRMFMVRVLAGSFTGGDPKYRRPPLKDPSRLDGPLFDSCVDNIVDPLIFVIFDRGQVYPEYLITYKK